MRRSSNSPRYFDVERPDLPAAQDVGDVARSDELGKPLDDGRLANTGITQDEGVVLLPTRKDLHHTLHLTVAPYHGVELAVCGELGEVSTKLLEHGAVLRLLRTLSHAAEELLAKADARWLRATLPTLAVALLDQLVDGVANRVRRDTHARKCRHRTVVALGYDAQK